jgi:Seed maturation protein
MLRCATALLALLSTCGAFAPNAAHSGSVKLVPATVPAVRASKVQAAAGKASGGRTEKARGSAAARAQSAADKAAAAARSGKTPMTQKAASRIQSAEARANNGRVEKGSWASKAQSAADRRADSESP